MCLSNELHCQSTSGSNKSHASAHSVLRFHVWARKKSDWLPAYIMDDYHFIAYIYTAAMSDDGMKPADYKYLEISMI